MGMISIGDVLKAQRDQFQGKVETITIQLLAQENTPQKSDGDGQADQAQEETTQAKSDEQ